jgi:hypothetical protein
MIQRNQILEIQEILLKEKNAFGNVSVSYATAIFQVLKAE